jgi:hypothetical protein
MLPSQNTLRLTSPLPNNLRNPPGDLIKPTTGNQDTGNGINDSKKKSQESRPLLADQQHNRLDIVLEEDTRNQGRRFGDLSALARGRVLVCEDCVAPVAGGVILVRRDYIQGTATLGLQSGNDGEEVLEFVVVAVTLGNCFVERV